jgi:hypothetical protein
MDNRRFFVESEIVDFDMSPDVDLSDCTRRSTADFCRPFVVDGPIIDAVRVQLRRRAETMGWVLDTSQPLGDLHLVVDGRRIDPVLRNLTARFLMPAGAGDGWLVSNTARPCDVGDGDDARHLGVCLTRLAIDDGFDERSVIAFDDPLLGDGLHDVEESCRRWTAGRARLPAALWNRVQGEFFLLFEIAGPTLPRWIKPLESQLIDGGKALSQRVA